MFTLLSATLVVFVNLVLGLVVFARNKKAPVHRIFFALVVSIITWMGANSLPEYAHSYSYILFWIKMAFVGSFFIPLFVFYFSVVFPENKPLSKTFKSLVILPIALSSLMFTNLIVSGIQDVKVHPIAPTYGPLYPAFGLYFIFFVLAAFYVIFKKLLRSSGPERAQLFYVIVGFFTALLFGMTTNLFLPMAGHNEYGTIGSFSTIFFVGFTAYAIVKHRLMDIRLLTLKLVSYSLAVALLIGGVIFAVALVYVKYQLITNLYLLTVMTGFSSILGFYFILRYFPKYTDRIFAKGRYNPQELLGKLGEIFSTKVILEDLTKATLKTLTKEMRLRRAAFIVTSSPEIRDVRQIGYKGVSKYNWEKAVSLMKDKLTLSEVEGRKIIVSDELEEGSNEKELLRKLNTEVLLPLSTEKEMVGLLALGEKASGDMFTAEDLRLLEIIAPQAAIALENATLVKGRDIRIAELNALNNLALSLGSTLSLDEILDQVIEEALRVTGAEDGSIMLLEGETQTLQIKCARGIEPEVSKKARTKLGEGIAGFVAEKGEPTLIINGRHENEYLESCLKREDINSALAVPLKVKEKVIGVLNVNRKKKREVFTKENLDLITSFAAQAAEAIDNAKLYQNLQETFFGTISSLAAAVDAKDHYTYGHSEAVTKHTIDIAQEMELPEEEIKNLEVAGKLHDIGKIGIDEKILNKPGKLTEEERKIINEHPKIAIDILKAVPSLKGIIPLILYHHERYDGKGYPAGLADDIIPLGARILAVADSFNAMRTDRPYRPALSLEEATQELKKCSGTQFDPQVVEAFLKVLTRKKPKLKAAA